MVFLYIYLALWAITFAYAVYDSHKKVTPSPFIKSYKFFGLKIAEPIWFLLLLSIIVAPISIFIWIYDGVKKRRRKAKKETTTNEEETTLHGYGLPYSIYTDVSKACVKAIMEDECDDLAKYLSEETVLLIYEKGQIKLDIYSLQDFIKEIRSAYFFDNMDAEPVCVEICNFIARPCVVIPHKDLYREQYILFRIVDDKLTHIVYTPVTVKVGVRCNPFEDLAFNTDFLNMRSYDNAEPMQNHLPCFACGAPSEELQWRRLSLKNTRYEIDGVVSICPHCQRQAEYYAEKQIEIPQPKHEDDKDLPF